MNVSFNDKEIDILNGKDIDKQKELIKVKVDDFKGTNIEDFFWICINAKKNKNKNQKKKLTVYKRPKDDNDEKKMDQDDKQKIQSLSMLIDFKLAKTLKTSGSLSTGHGMCPKGDVWFKKDEGMCMECESKENVMKCVDCGTRDKVAYVLCKSCRIMNLNKLEYESKMDNIKRTVIRAELSGKPSLSLDILCGLPRVSALDKLMKDIMALEAVDRSYYSLFLVDMDNLKALNSVLSHQGADEVIKNVGLTLKNWCVKVNNGEVKKLDKGFCFRQGGDEFAIIVRSEGWAYKTSFSDFFLGWKKEINNLVNSSFMDKYKPNDKDLKEGIKTLKERKKKKIETALNGIKIDKKIKTNIFDAVNNMDIGFDIEKIGISTGLFIPHGWDSKSTDWIRSAEIAQDAAKDIKGKNSISIYYEKINGVVPQNKTESCLEKGCAIGYYS